MLTFESQAVGAQEKIVMAQPEKQTAVHAKKRFHHGDLREALIAATRELLIEHGPDGFTLADACRRAGVTTAAPTSTSATSRRF
jgi:AcrR family transcriptional regulator